MINACGTSALLATLRLHPITTSLIEEFALEGSTRSRGPISPLASGFDHLTALVHKTVITVAAEYAIVIRYPAKGLSRFSWPGVGGDQRPR